MILWMRQSGPRYGRLCVLLLGLRVLLAFNDNLDATRRTALRPSVRTRLWRTARVLLVFRFTPNLCQSFGCMKTVVV